MGHDANVGLLGTTRSSFKEVSSHAGVIAAGAIVRQKSDGTITTAKADGEALGISLGVSQSGIDRTSVCRRGKGVPLRLTSAFNPVIGAQVHIDDVTGLGKASGSGVTGMNAKYVTGRLSTGGVAEDGTTGVGMAYIDMEGGL